ncbi:glycerophosphodiester phosphodiesterase family protein [Paenibacillus sp. KS-LC4]|uniref:glycerophosphodiester phosphodiesterase n=1 Tax=Paenibacillus sp. KS-LC4 TaxID=2979727 RepID=UPI0030CCFD41
MAEPRNVCVAHRGWSGRAPENTLAAVKLAMEEPDVYWIEIDVQLSNDHIPVVIHDYKLRRTTNGKGDVRNWTAAELGALDAGSWFSPLFKDEGVPTLDQVLALTAGRCNVNIELKTDGIRYPALEEQVLASVRRFGVENEVVLTSFYAGALNKLFKLTEGRIRTGLIIDGWRQTLPLELSQTGSTLLSIDYSRLNKERVRLLKEAGIQVMAWTINEERAIRKIAELDRELMICTNFPNRWRQAMAGLRDETGEGREKW